MSSHGEETKSKEVPFSEVPSASSIQYLMPNWPALAEFPYSLIFYSNGVQSDTRANSKVIHYVIFLTQRHRHAHGGIASDGIHLDSEKTSRQCCKQVWLLLPSFSNHSPAIHHKDKTTELTESLRPSKP